jgi:hypothetical protein
MRQMCCTNILESGYFSTGRINNINVPINSLVTVGITNDTVLLGLKIQSGYPLSTFFIKQLSFYYTGGGGKYAQFKVQMFSSNGSIGALTGGTPTFTQLTNSSVEYFLGNGTIYVSTPGFIIGSGYLDTATAIEIVSSINDSLQTRNLFTSYDTLYITGIASSAGTMGASLTFIEDI